MHTEFLDQLLVFVEFFESFNVHVWHVSSFGLVAVLLVSQDAHGELWSGQSLQPARKLYLLDSQL